MSSFGYDIFWDEAIKQLREDGFLSEQEFQMWFDKMSYDSSTESSLILAVPSKFFQDQIVQRYSDILEKKLFELSGNKLKLDFAIKKSDEIQNKPVIKEEIKEIKEQVKESKSIQNDIYKPADSSIPKQHPQLREDYIFSKYVIGNNNSFPTNAGKAIADNPGREYNPFLIYGGVGLGKTHLMQAIGNEVYRNNPEAKIIYIPAETFINEFIESVRNHTSKNFKNKYRKADILLIDDIHDFIGKTSTQEELFHTFNALYDSGKQLVFTCDRPPSELKDFSDRLKSRFERGLNVDLLPPDFETRVAILRKKIDEKHAKIPDEVLDFMSKNITTNIRDLESSLTKLIAYADLVGKEITMEIAKNQLKHVFQKPLATNITIDRVQRAVADYFNVTTNDLKSKKRSRVVTFPRQIAMYIIREITDYSTTEIGTDFGGRDHTTVMHSCQKIEDMLSTNSTLEPTINTIIRTIKESGTN